MKVINLRTRRKQAARDEKRKGAAENAARHGRGKAETALETARRDKAARDLDGHRRGREDSPPDRPCPDQPCPDLT